MLIDGASHSHEQSMYPKEPSEALNRHIANMLQPCDGGHGGCCKAWAIDANRLRFRAQHSI